jgi:sensor histidine kinase YesM
MKNENGGAAYWRFQILFWAAYTAFYLSFSVHYVGWTRAIIVGYLFYPLYSIGLTHLLYLEFRRWRSLSLPAWKKVAESILAILAIGVVQTFLIAMIDLPFEGRNSEFYQLSSLMYTTLGTTAAVGMWVFTYRYREHRELRTQLQLELREAELSALEAQINPHFLFNCLNSIRALVA